MYSIYNYTVCSFCYGHGHALLRHLIIKLNSLFRPNNFIDIDSSRVTQWWIDTVHEMLRPADLKIAYAAVLFRGPLEVFK